MGEIAQGMTRSALKAPEGAHATVTKASAEAIGSDEPMTLPEWERCNISNLTPEELLSHLDQLEVMT